MSKVPELTPTERAVAHNFAYKQYAKRQKKLGSGHFSVVYSHPTRTDVVVKVSPKSNDGGVLYAFWARAHQHLRGVPQILDIHQMAHEPQMDVETGIKHSTTTVITMKRYASTVDADPGYRVEDLGTISFAVSRDMASVLGGTGVGETVLGFTEIGRGYANTLQAIAKFFRGVSDFDLHRENVMIDYETGGLIIIDPLSFNRCEAPHEVIDRIAGSGSHIRGTSYGFAILDDIGANPAGPGDPAAIQHIPRHARLGEAPLAGRVIRDFPRINRTIDIIKLHGLSVSGEGVPQQAVPGSLRSLTL